MIDLDAIRHAPPRSSCLTTCSSFRLIRVLAEIKRFAGSLGISPEDAFGVFDFLNAGAAVPGGAKKIASGDFTATWELTMARKGAHLMVEEVGAPRRGAGNGVSHDHCLRRYNRARTRSLDSTAVANWTAAVDPLLQDRQKNDGTHNMTVRRSPHLL